MPERGRIEVIYDTPADWADLIQRLEDWERYAVGKVKYRLVG